MRQSSWLLQVLPVKGMDVVGQTPSSSGDVFVASSMSDLGIRRLAPFAFADQASMLADRGEFGAALELAALIPPTQVHSCFLVFLLSLIFERLQT